jgi:hypothetical protein
MISKLAPRRPLKLMQAIKRALYLTLPVALAAVIGLGAAQAETEVELSFESALVGRVEY